MKRGFTLIELLVVIAVVCVLASFLFPVFTAAKATAKSHVCASNLQQIGRAHSLYSSDWEDHLAFGPSPWGKYQAEQSHGYDWPHYQESLGPDIRTLLANYGTQPDSIWQCPEDLVETSIRSAWPASTYWKSTGSSYWYDQDAAFDRLTWGSMEKPSEWRLMDDLMGFHGGAHEFEAVGRRGNVVFYDLHVRSLPESRMGETDRTRSQAN